MTDIINLDFKQSQTIIQALNPVNARITALTGSSDANELLELSKLVAERGKLIRQLKSARKLEEAEDRRANADEMDDGELREAIEADIRDFLKAEDYRYVLADDTFWLQHHGSWIATTKTALTNHNQKLADRDYYAAFIDVLKADGRWFHNQTMTFGEVGASTLNRLVWNFLEPLDDAPHHWMFDALMESLGGGREENITHLERVIAAKHRDPSNYLLPVVAISDGGGTGKSLLAEIVLPIIFGRNLVSPNISMADVTGQFTASVTGKAVLFINESIHDKYDENALKRIAGSKTIRSERKGKDATEVDQTALIFVVGNGAQGSVRLTGSDIDRRFSVITNRKPLREVVANRLCITPAEAKKYIETEGQAILRDHAEVARWLHHIYRHPAAYIGALHGADYRLMIGRQRDLATEVIEAFLNDAKLASPGAFVNRSLIADCYLYEARRQNLRATYSRPRFIATLDEAVAKSADLHGRKVKLIANGKTTTANIIYRDTISTQGLKSNDALWVSTDEFGGKTWEIGLD